MDLDHARERIQEAEDVPAISDVLLELLRLVRTLDDDLCQLSLRVRDLERADMLRTDRKIG